MFQHRLETRQRGYDPLPYSAEDVAAALGGVRRVTWVGLFCNVVLSILKAVFGYLAGSQALIADAAHSFSDLASDVAVLVGVRYWSAPADADHPHGHRKVETVVTVFIGVMVGAVGIGIGWQALMTLAEHLGGGKVDAPTPGLAAAAVAAASVAVKELLYRWTVVEGRRLRSSAVIANAWHHRSDALSSIPVLVVVTAGWLGRRHGVTLAYLDPLAAILVGAMIVRASLSILRDAGDCLLDAGAGQRITGRLREIALATPGVKTIHRLRTRYLGPGGFSVDLHVLVDGDLTVRRGHDITEAVRARMMAVEPLVVEVLSHLEPDDLHERLRE